MSTLLAPAVSTAPPQRPHPRLLGGLEVLLVEDDDGILRLTRKMLERLGYRVVATADPLAALPLFEAGDFDLVLTDVVMPQMPGPTLVEHLRERDPRLPVVYMSGYAAAAAVADILGYRDPLLPKPFDLGELASVLASTCDQALPLWP